MRNETVNENRQDRKKKQIWTALFVLINIAVIAATAVNEFSGTPAGAFQFGFTRRALFFLGCTGLCLAVLLCAESLKYLLMMKFLGEPVSFRVAFETAALGKYYDCITPSGAGGQPFQILWLHRHGYSDGASSAMTISGYITMQAGFILLALGVFIPPVRTAEAGQKTGGNHGAGAGHAGQLPHQLFRDREG